MKVAVSIVAATWVGGAAGHARELDGFGEVLLTTDRAPSAEGQGISSEQLVIGMSQEFDHLNPLIAINSAAFIVNDTTMRPMSYVDAKWNWVCGLCAEMPTPENHQVKAITEKGTKKLEVTWNIRTGAKWGDGVPVTAGDFKLAWEIANSPNVSAQDKEDWAQIEEFRLDPKNDRRFTVKLKEARYSYNRQGGMFAVPRHIEGPVWDATHGSAGAYEKQSNYSLHPEMPGLYYGPYVVKEVKLGNQIVMERNPHFYGPAAKIKRLVFKVIGNTQSLEANLLSGAVDMIAEVGITFDQALNFKQRMATDPKMQERFTVNLSPGIVYEHIMPNLSNPILADFRVRKALLLSVDRESITHAFFEGLQKTTPTWVHPADPAYLSGVKTYSYDRAQAEKLLDEAGWAKGPDGIRVKNGERLSIPFSTTAGNKSRETIQAYLQAEWRKAGIEVVIHNEPGRVLFGESMPKRKLNGMIMLAVPGAPDVVPIGKFHTRSIPGPTNGFSGQNFMGYSSAKMDQLIDQANVELDAKKRRAMIGEMQKLFAEDLPQLPLYFRNEISITPKRLKNYRLTGHMYYSFYEVENWELASTGCAKSCSGSARPADYLRSPAWISRTRLSRVESR